MAIYMDGHNINKLELTASDGTTVTKELQEVGTIATPTEELGIYENGKYNVTNYASVNVTVAGGSSSSGGGTLLCELDADMTLKDVLALHPIPLGDVMDCIVILKHSGKNAPTSGAGTAKHTIFFVGSNTISESGYTTQPTATAMVTNYTTSLDAPDDLKFETLLGIASSYFSVTDDNKITSTGITDSTRLFPRGNKLYYTIIPIDWSGAMKYGNF